MLISRKIELDYGHTLPNHYSFCSQIHGHRAIVIAYFEGDVVNISGDSSQGMVIDFKILKELMMKQIHDVLDHGFAVWEDDVEDKEFIVRRNKKYIITEEPPTAEYLAKWAFRQIEPCLPSTIQLVKIEWYETPGSCAIFMKD